MGGGVDYWMFNNQQDNTLDLAMVVGVPGGERTMKEQDRLTRHSNIWLIWHDTESTKTACIYHFTDIESYYRTLAHYASYLFTTQSVRWTNSESETSGSGRSQVWERMRRTREKNQFGSFLLKMCSFKLIQLRTTHQNTSHKLFALT